jgi:hypothetical protein
VARKVLRARICDAKAVLSMRASVLTLNEMSCPATYSKNARKRPPTLQRRHINADHQPQTQFTPRYVIMWEVAFQYDAQKLKLTTQQNKRCQGNQLKMRNK